MSTSESEGEQLLSDAECALAAALGVDTEVLDWQGCRGEVSPATVRAVLTALGADVSSPEAAGASLVRHARERDQAALPPCVITQRGTAREVRVRATEAWLELEGETGVAGVADGAGRVELVVSAGAGGASSAEIPADLPIGYHRLHAATESGPSSVRVIVVPARADLDRLFGGSQVWGLAAQLYSVGSAQSWALGDLADLGALTAGAAARGADFVLINPLAAAQPVPPMEPSPYLPTTRLFTNPIYLRIEDVPEYDRVPEQQRTRHAAQSMALRASLARRDRIDRDAVWAAKREALEDLFAVPVDDARQQRLADFVTREGILLIDYATWCAIAEVYGGDSRRWPVDLRDPRSLAVSEFTAQWSARVAFHLWLQWLLDEQLEAAQARAVGAGMRLGIVHDLAVGVHPTGADAWILQDALAPGINVGAPPDAFNQVGQDWSQPPWRPDALERLGYEPFQRLASRLLRHAGGLRIDHVIGLFRLWWIPKGAPASAGTYVHYDHSALLGILLLEAERAGAVLVGEDLGNVEASAQDALAERGILGTSVLWFERDGDAPRAPESWRRDCLATVTTHDLPPTLGYLEGEHIRLRERLDLLTQPVEAELGAAATERAAWLDTLRARRLVSDAPTPDELALALHALVAGTPSRMVGVALTDAVGERLAQNQPGTSDEYPNWRIPLHGPDGRLLGLEDALALPRAAQLLGMVDRALRNREPADDA